MQHANRKHQQKRRRELGASLVELMVVVGIIGAVAAMAVANMPRLSRDMRIGRAAHTYAGMLREARGRAMADRAFVRVALTSAGMVMSEQNCPFGVTSSGSAFCGGWDDIVTYRFSGDQFRNVSISASKTSIYTPRGGLESGGSGSIQFASSVPGPTIKQTVDISAEGWAAKR